MNNEEQSLNGYDHKASVLKKIKYGLLVFLILILLFFFIGYRDDITLENLRYLLKYVDVSPSSIGSSDVRTITFDASALKTDVFRSDLVVLTSNEVATYDQSAKKGISDSVSLTSPSLSISDKYFSVFDMGENYYAIYNSFSKIYEETTPYAVWDVVLAENGEYCVITAEKGYRSALKIYNSEFNNKMNWYTTDKYIVCADIFSGRDIFYIAGCVKNNDSGDFLSSIILLREGSEKVEMTLEFPSELILNTEFYENGNICVLTDKALRVVDLTGKTLAVVSFTSDSLRMFECSDEYAALVLNENSIGTEHRMIILDKRGNTSIDAVVNSDIRDLSVRGSDVILLGSQSLTAFDADNGKYKEHITDKSYLNSHALGNSRALLIYSNNAYVVSIE
jgi:hypothetical protein